MAKIVYHNEEEVAPDELQEIRKSICSSCSNYTRENDSCSECSCMISRKVFYLYSDCPINKW